MKHVFTSPSSALVPAKLVKTRASNAKIHGMTNVDGYHIAYAATLVGYHFESSTQRLLISIGSVRYLFTGEIQRDGRILQLSRFLLSDPQLYYRRGG
jgi:hypothetical protein